MRNLFPVLLILMSSLAAYGQDSTIVIGIEPSEPFIEMGERGPRGLSVDFWQLVEDEADLRYEFRQYPTLAALLAAVESGEVDMSINPITVSEERMQVMDFSQPFFISGTAFVRKQKSMWYGVFNNVFSWRFFSAVGILLAVIFIFGALIWFFEHRRNKEQFGKGIKGLGDGFWWSAVTMTTVGYGDKAPVTRGGRIVGFVWMFAAILMISGLTASIASALTVTSLDAQLEGVEDLKRYKVGVVRSSNSANYLGLFGVEADNYDNIEEALKAVDNDELEVVVYDRPILRHHLKQLKLDELALSSQNLKTDYYSFAFPKGSKLRAYLDPFVVKALKSNSWSYRLKNLSEED